MEQTFTQVFLRSRWFSAAAATLLRVSQHSLAGSIKVMLLLCAMLLTGATGSWADDVITVKSYLTSAEGVQNQDGVVQNQNNVEWTQSPDGTYGARFITGETKAIKILDRPFSNVSPQTGFSLSFEAYYAGKSGTERVSAEDGNRMFAAMASWANMRNQFPNFDQLYTHDNTTDQRFTWFCIRTDQQNEFAWGYRAATRPETYSPTFFTYVEKRRYVYPGWHRPFMPTR